MKNKNTLQLLMASVLMGFIMSSCTVEYRERHRRPPPPPPVEEKVIIR